MPIIKYFIKYILMGILYYVLFSKGVLNIYEINIWNDSLKNESLGILLIISIINIILTLTIKLLSKNKERTVSVKTLIQMFFGIVISYLSFFCSVIISFIISMRTM